MVHNHRTKYNRGKKYIKEIVFGFNHVKVISWGGRTGTEFSGE